MLTNSQREQFDIVTYPVGVKNGSKICIYKMNCGMIFHLHVHTQLLNKTYYYDPAFLGNVGHNLCADFVSLS